MTIKRIPTKGLMVNPKFSTIYKDYQKLNDTECKNLLSYLYKGSSSRWVNPLTDKELNRNSKIIISFLSFIYYYLDDGSIVSIEGYDLSYREHVLNFIDEIHLYEKGRVSTTVISASARSPSPTRGTSQAARGTARSPSPTRGTSQAARGAPAVPVLAKSSSSSAKMSYSSPTIYKTAQSMVVRNDTSHKLSKDQCIIFAKEIRKLKKGLTKEQIKDLKIKNPMTTKEIGFKSPIFQRLLFKCYNNFDDDNVKRAISKVISKKFLEDLNTQIGDIQKDQRTAAEKASETKRLAEEKRKAAAQAAAQAAIDEEKRIRAANKPICDKYIDDYMKDFHKCCDKLESECDKNGVLSEFKYITDVVNAIVVVIFTKYLHLNYYYDDLYKNYTFDTPLPVNLIMYDDEMKEYCDSIGVDPGDKIIEISDKVIYQHNDFQQDISKTLIDTILRNDESYNRNTLLNRQYVFNMRKDGDRYFVNPVLSYNKYNQLKIREYIPMLTYRTLPFPATLEFAKKQFGFKQFNYNITNSGLPRNIFVTTEEVLRRHAPFNELLNEINKRLAKMPKIKEIRTEATDRYDFYEGTLQGMERQSFGTNDEIRRNILYSLNAQASNYVNRAHNYYRNIFYNYKYTGMLPIFSWIPLNKKDSQSSYNICKLAAIFRWQPYGYDKNARLKTLGDAYKNYGVAPFSKMLNEVIYKVISKANSSVLDIPNIDYEKDRLIHRVKETVGVYKNMDIDDQYVNNNVYFYHGTANRLHTMKDRNNDIEILGFLSTSLNIYTASYYSEAATRGAGYIYIIECDDKKTYINLNDQLFQFILLPNSIIRILYEFDRGAHTIIMCRLIMTPTKEENHELYNKLLGISQPAKKSDSDDAAAGISTGGIYSMKQIKEKLKDSAAYAAHASHASHASHTNTIIKPQKDVRKIGDMPADIREYYGLTDEKDNKHVDINNGCYVRLISRKVVDRMIENSK
jgi:hypothetical protein